MLLAMSRTVFVYLAVILAMRMMGKRQLGELQPSELVTTLLLSNVASICINEPELPLVSSLVPIFLIAALEILSSTASWYFPGYARLLFGKPVTVIRRGVIDQTALAKLRITAADLLEALRGKNVFSPKEVAWAVIETDGTLNMAVCAPGSGQTPMLPLLVERHLYRENLAWFSLDAAWLDRQLADRQLTRETALLFLYDGSRAVAVPRESKKHTETAFF